MGEKIELNAWKNPCIAYFLVASCTNCSTSLGIPSSAFPKLRGSVNFFPHAGWAMIADHGKHAQRKKSGEYGILDLLFPGYQ